MKQVISQKRVRDYGEVYTNKKEVLAMLDMLESNADLNTGDFKSTYLEPACGTGNFLIEILKRKIEKINSITPKRKRTEWEFNVLIAVGSLYGIDIIEDNIEICRSNLLNIVIDAYEDRYNKDVNSEFIPNINFILDKNMVCGDARSYRLSDDEPIIFWEWTGDLRYRIRGKAYSFEKIVNGDVDIKNQTPEELKSTIPFTYYSQLYLQKENESCKP